MFVKHFVQGPQKINVSEEENINFEPYLRVTKKGRPLKVEYLPIIRLTFKNILDHLF